MGDDYRYPEELKEEEYKKLLKELNKANEQLEERKKYKVVKDSDNG